MVDHGRVDVRLDGGVGRVEFSHSQSNSLPGQLLRAVASRIDEVARDPSVRVIILQSAGDKAFCAGASFDELLAVESLEQSRHFFSGFSILINAIRKCPLLVIARVQGKAVGGGVGLIAASDYAIAVSSASVRLSEFALGFGPFVIGPAVERRLGTAVFAEMSIDTEWRDASWLYQRGLYAKLCQSQSELDQSVSELAGKLSNSSREASLELKRVLWQGCEDWDRLLAERVEITARLALSEFAQGKIRAFKTTKS